MDPINLLLRGLRIDWEEISGRSYLRGIPAISGLSEMEKPKILRPFKKPLTRAAWSISRLESI